MSGFPEFLPEQRVVEQRVLEALQQTFELYGFAGLETRAVEPMDQLLRTGETSKEVYVLRRLQEHDTTTNQDIGLHFDLTVPFARYVLENAGKLEFPFRRYQIQKVWRGERPQEGRFREFTQADIDVVGRDHLPPHHDIEVARVMVAALSRLDFLPEFRLQVNNRKLIQGFYAGLGVSVEDGQTEQVMRIVDKGDKLPPDQLRQLLIDDARLAGDQADACLALATIRTSDASFATKVRDFGVKHRLLDEGLDELVAVVEGCAALASDRVKVEADLSIARGLDYYTGTVFETLLAGHESLGSICSGGRYDALASDSKASYPGVGISFGVSRVLVPLLHRGAVTADRRVPSAVLVALIDEERRPVSEGVAEVLRRRGIPCETATEALKFGKQIRYAERRGIPYVWFPAVDDEEHQVKDIRSGEQVVADLDAWVPPARDLRPQVINTMTETDPQ